MGDLVVMVALVVGRAALERAAGWLFAPAAGQVAAARWGLRLSLGGALLLELERTTP